MKPTARVKSGHDRLSYQSEIQFSANSYVTTCVWLETIMVEFSANSYVAI